MMVLVKIVMVMKTLVVVMMAVLMIAVRMMVVTMMKMAMMAMSVILSNINEMLILPLLFRLMMMMVRIKLKNYQTEPTILFLLYH